PSEFFTSTDTGRILVTVLGMVAEMERRLILELQWVGIDAAKRKGIYKGRKPSVPVETVRKMRDDGKGPTEIAAALGMSRMSVWRALSDGTQGDVLVDMAVVTLQSSTGPIHPPPAPVGDGERINLFRALAIGERVGNAGSDLFRSPMKRLLSCAISAMRRPW